MSLDAGEQALDITDRFGESRHWIFGVLLIFKADEPFVIDLEDCLQNRFGIQDSATAFDRRVFVAECRNILHVEVVEAVLALENALSGVNAGAVSVANYQAQDD